jgi:hypothetical protein
MESKKSPEVEEEAIAPETEGHQEGHPRKRVPIRTADLGPPQVDLTQRKTWIPALEAGTDQRQIVGGYPI